MDIIYNIYQRNKASELLLNTLIVPVLGLAVFVTDCIF